MQQLVPIDGEPVPGSTDTMAVINGWAFAANNVSMDPGVTNYATQDYRLASATLPNAVRDSGIAGTIWSFTDDILAASRGSVWSMWAYEYPNE